MAAEEVIPVTLDADLARVDALATQHGLAGEATLARLVHVGAEPLERRAESAGGREGEDPRAPDAPPGPILWRRRGERGRTHARARRRR